MYYYEDNPDKTRVQCANRTNVQTKWIYLQNSWVIPDDKEDLACRILERKHTKEIQIETKKKYM